MSTCRAEGMCGQCGQKALPPDGPLHAPDQPLPAGEVVVQQHLLLLVETLLETDQNALQIEVGLQVIHSSPGTGPRRSGCPAVGQLAPRVLLG